MHEKLKGLQLLGIKHRALGLSYQYSDHQDMTPRQPGSNSVGVSTGNSTGSSCCLVTPNVHFHLIQLNVHVFIFRDVFTRILFTIFPTNNISIIQIDPKLLHLLKLSKSYRILHLMHEVGFPLCSMMHTRGRIPEVCKLSQNNLFYSGKFHMHFADSH